MSPAIASNTASTRKRRASDGFRRGGNEGSPLGSEPSIEILAEDLRTARRFPPLRLQSGEGSSGFVERELVDVFFVQVLQFLAPKVS